MPHKSRPIITVGVPLFNGADHLPETLASIQAQTWHDLEVLISVDGGDQTSAAACRPFLSDPRFTMTERCVRLDWAGNSNWLMQHAAGQFFSYLEQDDLIEPTYFEKLHHAITSNPEAAVSYSDVRWFEGHEGIVFQDSLTGTPGERFRRHVELLGWIPLRGLIPTDLIRRIGLLRITEFRSCLEEIVWLSKLALVGNCIRVPEVLYRKRFHAGATHGKFHAWPSERRMDSWVVAFSGLAGAIPLVGPSLEERSELFDVLLDRMLIETPGRWAFYETGHLSPSQKRDLVVHLLNRIVHEGEVLISDLLGSNWIDRLNRGLGKLGLSPFAEQEISECLPGV